MEKNDFTYSIIVGFPRTEIFLKLKDCYCNIFEDADVSFFEQRFKEKKDFISILAIKSEELIGFKIGYRYDANTFYSWIGGVKAPYRKKGVAQHLFESLEKELKSNHYTKLRTKSMNQFKPMILSNIKNGLDIKQVYTNSKGQEKIVFEKLLN